MAKASDLMNKSGGGGFVPKPAAKPVVMTGGPESHGQSPHSGKQHPKDKGPKPAVKGAAGGGSVPIGVRPKV